MDDPTNKKLTVNQLVHGYEDGHRLLGGSIKPKGKDAKTLLTMTDLAGYGDVLEKDGYLAGYPLPEMGVYALTRTWMATEMPRPGCVWSHTLLIDFSDLAYICSTEFLKLFKRPTPDISKKDYSNILFMESDFGINEDSYLPDKALANLVYAVYSFPKDSILINACNGLPIEQLVLSLWLQQWPRLRRNFRFCTSTYLHRSAIVEGFDIQFLQQNNYYNHSNRMREKLKKFDLSDCNYDIDKKWISTAVDDVLFEGCNSSFRKFIGKYGAEINNGRSAFIPLVLVWNALYRDNDFDFKSAIDALSKINPPIDSLTLNVANELLHWLEKVDKPKKYAIDFLLNNFDLLGDSFIIKNLDFLAKIISRNTPEYILALFNSGSDIKKSLAIAATQWMLPDEVLQNANGSVDFLCEAIEANPAIAESQIVWELPSSTLQDVANVLGNSNYLSENILNAMLRGTTNNIPSIGINLFGQRAVDAAVALYDEQSRHGRDNSKRWLFEAKNYPEMLVNAISNCEIKNLETLSYLSSLVGYDAFFSASHDDSWLVAIDSTGKQLSEENLDLGVFLLVRAMSRKSNRPEIIIAKAFEPVHKALMESRLPYDAWSFLEKELPRVSLLSKWDKANRLRMGVIEIFADGKFPVDEFLGITDDLKLFSRLVKTAIDSSKGKKYLKKIFSNYKAKKNSSDLKKTLIIQKFLFNRKMDG